MARNSIHINAAPDAVWATLEDPYAYPKWVVGADRTLEADPDWPAPETRFKVKLALGAEDYTKVQEVDAPRRIVLHAAHVFFGPARVELVLEAARGGTDVTIIEDPVGKLAPLAFLPPVQLAIKLRNVEAMKRFRRLVESRAAVA